MVAGGFPEMSDTTREMPVDLIDDATRDQIQKIVR